MSIAEGGVGVHYDIERFFFVLAYDEYKFQFILNPFDSVI